jgi:hypothetical protein
MQSSEDGLEFEKKNLTLATGHRPQALLSTVNKFRVP